MFPTRRTRVRASWPAQTKPFASARLLIAIVAALGAALAMPATGAASGFYGTSTNDGSKVVFTSNEGLVGGDTDHSYDLYQRVGGTTSRLSQGQINGNGPFNANFEGASVDQSKVFFSTDERLVSADTDNSSDVYMRSGGATTLISRGQVNGNGTFDATFEAASNDGSKVFFSTREQLVGADTDGSVDVYERSGGTTTLISRGQVNGNGAFDVVLRSTDCPRGTCGLVTADGSKVFFTTGEQLVSQDTDSAWDTYERAGGTTKLVSKGQINGNGSDYAFFQGASADGSKAWFITDEQLVDADIDSATDVYQRSGGVTTLVSSGQVNGNGNFGSYFDGATGDGSKVWFDTREALVSGDTDTADDVYQHSGGTTTWISQGKINGNGDFNATGVLANSDGSRVFFETDEPLVAADVNNVLDTYQRSGGKTTWVTQGPVSFTGSSHGAPISGIANDGATVFFDTEEPLVSGDTDNSYDVYQRSAGKTTRLSQGQINGNGEFDAFFRGSSIDGSKVFFETDEKLVAADHDHTVDVYERSGGTVKLISG